MGCRRRGGPLVGAIAWLSSGCLLAPNANATSDSSGGETETSSGTESQTGPSGTGQTGTGSSTDATTTGMTTVDSTTSTSGTTSGSTGAEGTGTSTGEVLPIGCYEDGTHPYAGTLCGPAATPCEVSVDEAASAAFTFTNGSPSITYDADCNPQILYSVAVGGFNGHFLQRDGADDWSDENTPFAHGRGTIVYDALADGWQVISGDGAFGVHYWTRDSGGLWTEEGTLNGQYGTYQKSVAGDGAGGLHVLVWVQGGGTDYAVYDGDWTYSTISDGGTRAFLGLGVDGVPHFAWFESGGGWNLTYATPASIPAVAIPYGSSGLGAFDHAVTVLPDGPQGDPRIVTLLDIGGGLREMAYLTLQGTTWSAATFATETPGTVCLGDPDAPGQTCNYDYTRYRPLDIVSSGSGDVRILYSEDHEVGTLTSNCMMMFCFWEPSIDNSEYTVHIAWPIDGAIESTALWSGDRISGADAEVDDLGRMQIAGYARDSSNDIVVQYLQVSG